jgi:hypothetical protein
MCFGERDNFITESKTMKLIFKWDAAKARHNIIKHKISFEDAKTIFNDPLLITFPDYEHSDTEDRFISIGISSKRRVLLVVHTETEEDEDTIIIRVISSRRTTAYERRKYEEGRDEKI